MANTPELQIRLAVPDDLPAIVELLSHDSFQDPPPGSEPTAEQRRAFDLIAAHPDHDIVVAVFDGEIVGTLQLTVIPGISHKGTWRVQVEAVRVRGDLRNQRIGTRLMEWAIARARERNCWVVQLTSNLARVDAHRFYERLGFEPSHLGMKLYL